jgi:hypothetical protein
MQKRRCLATGLAALETLAAQEKGHFQVTVCYDCPVSFFLMINMNAQRAHWKILKYEGSFGI